jgi:predicted RNA-binding Zn-ribbon protein involved in translation (DUF1610 family)
MFQENMLAEMLWRVRLDGGTEDQVNAYIEKWNMAVEDRQKAMPCPLCFMKGEAQRLHPMSDENGVGIVRCARCREYFTYNSSVS